MAHAPYPIVIVVYHLFIVVWEHPKECLNLHCLGIFEGETGGHCPWPTVPGGGVPYNYGDVAFFEGGSGGGGLLSM